MTPFGSPRVPKTTPLKNSISQLRRRSAPVKEEEEGVSPAKKAATPKQSPAKKAATPKAKQSPAKKAATPKQSPAKKAATPKQSPAKKAATPKPSPAKKAATPKTTPKSAAPKSASTFSSTICLKQTKNFDPGDDYSLLKIVYLPIQKCNQLADTFN